MSSWQHALARPARAVSTVVAVSIVCVSCAIPPRGNLRAAKWFLKRGDLLGSIERLDRVPPADVDYAQSRAMAGTIERRIRASQDLFDQGLALRAEWRDEEAMDRFDAVLEVWPKHEGASRMRRATQARLNWLLAGDVRRRDRVLPGGGSVATSTAGRQGAGLGPSPVGVVVSTRPLLGDLESRGPEVRQGVSATVARAPTATPAAPSPLGEVALPVVPQELAAAEILPTGGERVATVPREPEVSQSVPEDEQDAADEPAELSTVDWEARLLQHLDEGDLEQALSLAERLELGLGTVPRRLVRVLHQRALLRYGQGELELALSDWARLLRIEPSHAEAAKFADAARAELAIR